MSNLGIGVMIQALGGNRSTVEAYRKSFGKIISSAELLDDVLILKFDDGSGIKFSDEGQSCCESRYMRTDDNLQDYIGAKFLGAEIKEAHDMEDGYETHEVQFLEIQTSKGVFTMSSHNEHNGYYGGFYIQIQELT